MINLSSEIKHIFETLGIGSSNPAFCTGSQWGKVTDSVQFPANTPITNEAIASVGLIEAKEYNLVVEKAQQAFQKWRMVPAPQRGEIVRQIGLELRKYKSELGKLVTLECGKIVQEGMGEVQEMIDICDYAVGLSRQLHGFTMHSERPQHRMYEQYHPMGPVGVISAFNFPVAVWSWNAMIAAVCGDVIIWKPSPKVPLCAIACHKIIARVLASNDVPEGVFNLIIGDASIGASMAEDSRIPLISATGSIAMGKKVGAAVGARLGKSILELGGNNAVIVSEHADLEMAIRAIVFGAVGTAGQRCTSTRRLIIHEKIFTELQERLIKIYRSLPIGNPFDDNTLVGPLIDADAVTNFEDALQSIREQGGEILIGGKTVDLDGGNYVEPTLVVAKNEMPIVQDETFAPILYLIRYQGDIQNAIDIQNGVRQGLSSAIFTQHLRESERFLSHAGSDCGIANVNIGTSGAEIGGAFGGEKETGGGRESGSDVWKYYMRRQTNTINYGDELPLAQGIRFDV